MKRNKKVKLIAAVTPEMGIGYQGKLIYRIKEDLQHFQRTTMGHIVVMGRKTFDEIGKPLNGRINIVITSDETFNVDGVIRAGSLEEAYQLASPYPNDVFIIGGESVYQQAIDDADEIILTEIVDTSAKQHPAVDKFFPQIPFGTKVKTWQPQKVGEYILTVYTMKRVDGESS